MGYTIRAIVPIDNNEVIFAGDQGDIIMLKFTDIWALEIDLRI